MRVAMYPFCSQQDKRTGKFLLTTCAACKPMAYMAARMRELGWQVSVVLPLESQCQDPSPFEGCTEVRTYIPTDNPTQRVHWDVLILQSIANCDVVLCNHEYMAAPMRVVSKTVKIVQMCLVKPDRNVLFVAAWEAADLVVTIGLYASSKIHTNTPITVWPMSYDADAFQFHEGPRPVDMLFVPRCSVTGYTLHGQFLDAVRDTGLRVAFTDVTNYLRKSRPDLEYSTPETYLQYLQQSKVAVATQDDWYGGSAIRDAIAVGCVPIVLDTPAYRELVGPDWPCVIRRADYGDTFCSAMEAAKTVDCTALRSRILSESYQAAWPTVLQDLESL